MGFRMNYIFIWCLLASIYSCQGCSMENVTTWQLPITVRIEDYFDGILLQRAVTDIGGFNLVSSSDLNGGPYFAASIEDSSFILRTNEAYRMFEEYETVDLITLTYAFTCTNGQTPSSPLTFRIEINDNNNNPPIFKTPDTAASETTTYDFTIATPVPPGFLITNCVSDIVVRDIDLTTYRIDFSIEDNPYIGIEYDGSAVAKEFKAVLRSTTFIRSISEPIVLTISATDVDLTGDPPITRNTTVTIHGSSEFEMPLEPMFTQAFYLASYSEDDQVTVEQPISLEQGYDDYVQFSMEGEYAADHFNITVNGNLVTLSVTNPLPAAAYQEGQIYLVVHAAREHTSGASATIVVQLPEAVHLEFERPHYEGQIVDNALLLTQLILSQGYQGSDVIVAVEDYSPFFTASAVGNTITLSMTPLDDSIIQENNFINLRVTASTDHSSATTIVTLEIVKDDISTPVFEQTLYTGTYDSTAGLTVDPILLVRGYDDTVTVTLSGEYESYFELTRDGPSSVLRLVLDLPSHILSQSHLHLSVEATKPRTVGASAVVAISLPGAREMQFEAQSYKGSVQDNTLTLETIVLSVGYEEDVAFSLSGDYSTSFNVTNVRNQVTITMTAQLPQEVISENNFLMLTVTAEGVGALPTTTAVVLEIMKVDATTPVFSQAIYSGTYLGSLGIELENISLVQGYDSNVTFRIQGENSEYFFTVQTQNSVTLALQLPIPEEVMFQEKAFVFNIFADKPLTVGANAAIVINFPEELIESTVMQFAKNTYVGSLENNELTLEDIVLDTGFAFGTQFSLSGDYAAYFTHTVTESIVTFSLPNGLPSEVLENKFIVLELEASRDRAVSVVTGIIIDIVQEEIVTPVFSQAYYSGAYTEDNALQFLETISLTQGFDETVTFGLEGESAAWFGVLQSGNFATIVNTSPLPQDVLDSYHQLLFTVVAYKPNSANGHAAISIELPKDLLEQEVLRFAQSSYVGQLDGTQLQVPTITLSNEITENVIVSLSGAYATYFTATRDSNTVHIELINELPSEVLSNNDFIVLDIIASKTDAVSGYSALILTIVKEPTIITPVFEQAYYTGEIEQDELIFEHTMRLIQGFDESVTFSLSGDGSERFILTQTGQNSFSLSGAQGGLEGIENISHFVFSLVASKAGNVSGHAAIVIHNKDSSTASTIKFSQNYYKGSLEENVLTMESISISEGYSLDVNLTLSGDYVDYFQLVGQGDTYSLQLVSAIPNEVIEAHTMFVYTVEANGNNARTHATIIVELIKNNNDETEALAFDDTYYVGTYSASTGSMGDINLQVVAGYDIGTTFTLQGDNAAWFNIQNTENEVTITLAAPLPAELFIDNQPVIFTVNATNSGGSTAIATIVVSLEGELSELNVLGFERNNYLGTIESDTSTLEPITLTQGYSSEVYFTLQGDLSNYFSINQQDATVNIQLQSAIPETELSENHIIVLELQATAVQAVSATATLVFEVVTGQELSFSAPYYVGQYSETESLVFDTTISLAVGFDQDVQFSLEGEHAQWFALEIQGNAATLTVTSAIPPAILSDNHQLVFSVTAQKPRSNSARAAIVISLIDESTNMAILGFEQTSYIGSIDNDALSIEPITLNEGYTDNVTFTLSGDLSSYFNLQQQGSTVNIVLQSAIPEQSLPSNSILLLELRASAPDAIPATTIVVIEAQRTIAVEELAFNAAYYIGEYREASGLTFSSIISLDVGYDQNVQFTLDGENSQWFALEVQGNEVTLTISGAIPPAILVNNHQLVFSIIAHKPNSNNATATIVVSLIDDFTDAAILGFERASYLGSIENDVLSIDPIILNEGYSETVTFTLSGDLASYFILQQQGSTVNIVLQSAIPEQSLPSNGIVMLVLRASAPDSIPALTTVVIEAQRTIAVEELAFNAAYYIGEYSEASGLTFSSIISLDVGYDQNVQFTLDGENSQWFALEVQGNEVTLTISGAIPPAILVNNHQLVFSIIAHKPNSNNATATIVVSLVDDFTDAAILGFERASYLGSIENDVLSIYPIILNEGYSETVTFTLSGDLASYFILQQQGSTVNIVLQSAIPEQSLPSNGIVMLVLRASAPDSIPALTTVVIEAQRTIAVEELAFNAAYYIREYSEASGLTFSSIISLDVGYDQNVQFTLDGENSQWFALEVQGNEVTLTISGAIPPANLVNNHQLVFSIIAHKPNSNNATATIVVSLIDDFTDAAILGFERASYLGSIENDVLSIDPIILNEGYSETVTFTLSGDLASYFILQQQGSTVNIVLQSAIPEQSLPSNGIVMLVLRASAPDSIPALTTVVIEAQRTIAVEELAFNAAYYIGEYSEASGLTFSSIISLDVGYDQNVQFTLDGENSQWFALEVQGNEVTLTISGAIPPAILVNNHQLVFSIIAHKPNSNNATATIVVSLVDDFTDAAILGFERASYLGSIENDVLSIYPIILNEGYSETVTFTLSGDLASYFILQQQGSTVNIVLQSAIPEQSLPSNGIVMLVLRASAPDSIPALTTVVIEAQRTIAVEELAFNAAYYIGEYSEASGLTFSSIISLDVGYDQNVQFTLDGENSQWFALEVQGNEVTLTISGAIPPAILVNNHQLVFSIIAHKPNSNNATATIVVSLVDDFTDAAILGFERASYLGSIENDILSIYPIILNEGYSETVTFTLSGDLASYFILQQQGSTVNIVLQSAIPEQSLPSNGIVMLVLRASAPDSIPALTTVVIEAQRTIAVEELAFNAAYYIGEYSEASGLTFSSIISLDVGYDQNVQFTLDGENSQLFALEVQGNEVTLTISGAIPPAILVNNHQLVFSIIAHKPNSNNATATIVVSLIDDFTDAAILGFERASYLGSIENDVLTIEPIILNEGYSETVIFTLSGDLASYFILQQQGSTVNIVLQSAIPEQSLPSNDIVMLVLRASAPDAIPATTIVVIEAQRTIAVEELAFNAAYYIGEYSEASGLVFSSIISLDVGYDQNVQFTLDGENSQWFALEVQGNEVTLTMSGAIPPAILVNNHQLVFSVIAQKPNSNNAIATIVVSLVDDFTDAAILGFERASYLGSIENDVLTIEPIILNEGYSETVTFTLSGDLASYFILQQQGFTVNIILQTAIPEQALPANGIVLLELRASAPQTVPAMTTLVIEAQRRVIAEELAFTADYYTGEYSGTGGLAFDTTISLDAGYDQDVSFTLEGDHAQWFALNVDGNSITLVLSEPIPSAVLDDLRKIILVVRARKSDFAASTIIVISVIDNSGTVVNEAFDKVLYEGTINLNVVQHEPITITGLAAGIDIEIYGVYRELFSATVSEDTVVVRAAGALNLPEDVSHVALELRAGGASAVLILGVSQSETPELPTVTFGSQSYVLRADMAQTGLLGQVQATASNGETITYTLAVDDAHLLERISINSVGEIHLSAPTNTGVYSFDAIATSSITQVRATATVQLAVEAAATCGDDHTLPPLIILDRDEEEPHTNLVVLDSLPAGCQFSLTNRWPLDQDWLYVDNTGLHSRSIDREDPRIAFMALSQIQVELILECPSDTRRAKRSIVHPTLDWLGPYDYGSNKWILTDTILYNSRRSFVNLIVNDINDNYPIFVGHGNEPVVCGYPVPELEDVVLPRALAELKATDADVGENAALSFWSSSEELAVASTTGFVHVRDGAVLAHDQRLTVSVTDLNGREDGLTTSMELLVKLLDTSHIAVVTVRNAFLDQEETILGNLSSAVGYEVKVLSSAVISDDPADSANARRKRQVTTEGASLQLYVYGVIDREPVAVGQLTNDITENVLYGVDVTSTVSLEDHLEGREIYHTGRDTGLLVATIVLSVLLFILMMLIALWFFLRWRASRNYDQFSDANSLASRSEPMESPPKADSLRKPRLNIEELKRSERRLQEMLDAPIDEVGPKAQTTQPVPEESIDTIINMAPTRSADVPTPIVIQSIDKLKDDEHSGDEDEFGERLNKSRKKSVVTFNENVEKIIHVEDIPDDNSSDVEIFKF